VSKAGNGMVNVMSIVVVFIAGAIVSFAVTPLARRVALKNNIMAQPGDRMVHTEPTPYLGAVAIYFAFVMALAVGIYINRDILCKSIDKLNALFFASTFIFALGLWDDIKNINPLVKLCGQIVIALFLFSFGFRVGVVTNIFLGGEFRLPLYLSAFITVFWYVGMINAMNLIDGLDGLAAGITVIASGALILVSFYLGNYVDILILAALAGSALGFLKFNFYPAKIFMGDAGSMLLGLVLASVALLGSQHKAATAVALLTPIAALAIPIGDVLIAVIRRVIRKQPIFKADMFHIHHRMLIIGLNQKQIVLFIYLVTLYLGIFSFLFILIPDKFALILLILLTLGLSMGMIVIRFIERKLRYLYRLEERSHNK